MGREIPYYFVYRVAFCLHFIIFSSIALVFPSDDALKMASGDLWKASCISLIRWEAGLPSHTLLSFRAAIDPLLHDFKNCLARSRHPTAAFPKPRSVDVCCKKTSDLSVRGAFMCAFLSKLAFVRFLCCFLCGATLHLALRPPALVKFLCESREVVHSLAVQITCCTIFEEACFDCFRADNVIHFTCSNTIDLFCNAVNIIAQFVSLWMGRHENLCSPGRRSNSS